MTKFQIIPGLVHTPTDDDVEEAKCITENGTIQVWLLHDFVAQYTTGFREGIEWAITVTCPVCTDRIRVALAVHDAAIREKVTP